MLTLSWFMFFWCLVTFLLSLGLPRVIGLVVQGVVLALFGLRLMGVW